DLGGRAGLTTDALPATLRRGLGLAPRPPIALPAPLLRLAARLGAVWPGASLTPETLAMLAAGSTGDPAPAEAALGWRARPLPLALAAEPAVAADRWHARLLPARPVIRAGLAAVWLGSGLIPLLLTPPAVNAALLAGLGLTGAAALAALWGGALLDLAIGLGLLLPGRQRRAALRASLAVTLGFSLLASFAAPGLWAHPFGPLLKNFSLFAAALALLAMED
ncbi:DoxX-like family protein, partial [Teichococcus deserti]|uniref:DoxX-like family protein n=1 Tax=Teichococcus deserti TaxID=1817963 RepID=UPI001A97D221